MEEHPVAVLAEIRIAEMSVPLELYNMVTLASGMKPGL
jgi:hypothetical protein